MSRLKFIRKRRVLAAILVAGLALALWLPGAVRADDAPQRLPLEALSVITGVGTLHFDVEVARTDETRATGLMHRREMAPDHGMLFDFRQDRMVTMWMRNTFIPLDMLFITKDGVIVRVTRNTTPHSERRLPSGEPVRAVLELNAGSAALLGIEAGDKVEHPMFADQ